MNIVLMKDLNSFIQISYLLLHTATWSSVSWAEYAFEAGATRCSVGKGHLS